jgi:hypothetical protein
MIILPRTIGRASLRFATAADLVPVLAEILDRPTGTIYGWHFVRVEADAGAKLHVLGSQWRDVYITSPIQRWNVDNQTILTRSGHIYRLTHPGDDADMHPGLGKHLVVALYTWRFAQAGDV